MKTKLIYTTTKPESDNINALTLSRLARKKQRQLIKQLSNSTQNILKANRIKSLNDCMFYELKQRQLIKQLSNSTQNILKSNRIKSLCDCMSYELKNDVIEQQKLDILQNSELPFEVNSSLIVKLYFDKFPYPENSIGWHIERYIQAHKLL